MKQEIVKSTGNKRKTLLKIFLTMVMVWVVSTGIDISACTSFQLKTDKGLFFVHSLNQGNVKSVPGIIFINSRNKWKKGYDWRSLVNVKEKTEPTLVWKSKFGSVTFNPFGKELPDGGMNEAKLFIWEKNFNVQYPNDKNKPKLFQAQWMQYVLDNFSTVDEVIENAKNMSLDGWGWHYFVADETGKTAIIDFLDGKTVVYSGADMPVTLACNSHYSEAMKWLKMHKGFGGDLEITKIHEEIPRFVYGAKLLKDFKSQDSVDYSFHVLDEMSKNVRWSIVIDVKNMRVFFKTNVNQNVRFFDVTSADFDRNDGPLMLDIECPEPKNIRSRFTPYNRDEHKKLLSSLYGMCLTKKEYREHLFIRQGIDIDGVEVNQLVQSVLDKIESADDVPYDDIQGEWNGTVTLTSSKTKKSYPVSLVLKEEDNKFSGTFLDKRAGETAKTIPISNVKYNGGLLSFSVKSPESVDLIDFRLYLTMDGWKGYLEYWNKWGTAAVHLKKCKGFSVFSSLLVIPVISLN